MGYNLANIRPPSSPSQTPNPCPRACRNIIYESRIIPLATSNPPIPPNPRVIRLIDLSRTIRERTEEETVVRVC
jgi:hypothetical protein